MTPDAIRSRPSSSTGSVSPARRRRRARGFTLIELLAAIALFGILAAMLFQMVKNGLDLWKTGETRKESVEKTTALIDQIAADLSMLVSEQQPGAVDAPVRLVADYGLFDLDGDKTEEAYVQRLRFVRACPEERFDARLRAAGETAGAAGSSDDLTVGGGAGARAPGGLAEIAYTTIRLPAQKGTDAAPMSLVRTFRTPIAGSDSVFAAGAFDSAKRVLQDGTVMAETVLFLGFEFWSRDTRSWDDVANSAEGPLTTWDSTRALLLDKTGANRFLLAKDKSSLARSDDDVVPRFIRVTLVLEQDSDEVRNLALIGDLPPSAKAMRVGDVRPFETGVRAHKFVKIDSEWIAYTDVVAGEVRILRGQRGTAAVQHAEGARIHFGETIERTIEIPVYREDWNDE